VPVTIKVTDCDVGVVPVFVMPPPPPPQPTEKKESDVARKTSPIAFIARRLLLPTRFLRSAKTLPNKPRPGKRKMKP